MILFLMAGLTSIQAQQQMQINTASNLSIYGTSNVHDWSEHVNEMNGDISLTIANDRITNIASLHFSTQVASIKSGKSTMDEYTHEALKYEDHPNIAFTAKSIEVSPSSEGHYKVAATGTMRIAGFDRQEKVEASCALSGGKLSCEGVKKIDMTSYKVEPPSIMFGAMTVGKDVEVHFEIIYN